MVVIVPKYFGAKDTVLASTSPNVLPKLQPFTNHLKGQ